MKLICLLVIFFLGVCQAKDAINKKVLKENEGRCIWTKMAQCLGQLLLKGSTIFYDGKTSVDIETREEFGDCIVELTSCLTAFGKKISQKQKDFCGDKKDCYDDEEDEEDEEKHSKYSGLSGCFLKNKDIFFKELAEICMDVLGSVKHMMSNTSDKNLTPTLMLCRMMVNNLASIKRILNEKCGGGGETFMLIVGISMKQTSPYIYELCQLDRVLKHMVL